MEEKTSNVGRQLLKALIRRRFSHDMINHVVGTVAFSQNPTEVKTALLKYLEENPTATEEELFRKTQVFLRENP